tara:strand:+ start:506 stop:727 length:222 start_codon:yes stop_codon:yes gene_type:complete
LDGRAIRSGDRECPLRLAVSVFGDTIDFLMRFPRKTLNYNSFMIAHNHFSYAGWELEGLLDDEPSAGPVGDEL